MFDYFDGIIKEKTNSNVVLEVNGIGYLFTISMQTFTQLEDLEKKQKIYAYLHIKEDEHKLFGFYNKIERELFFKLLSVNGIGPVSAMSILTHLGIDTIIKSIVAKNSSVFNSVKGIGKKTAEKLVIELSDKLDNINISKNDGLDISAFDIIEKATSALINLGAQKSTTKQIVVNIFKEHKGNITLENLIRESLKKI